MAFNPNNPSKNPDTNLNTDAIKFRPNGDPYFVIPELESSNNVDGPNDVFLRELNTSYTGKNQFDYNVSLPVEPLAFWDKFNMGILREYARLLPDEVSEIRILPYAEDYTRTPHCVNELKVIASEAFRRRSEEYEHSLKTAFENNRRTVWNSHNVNPEAEMISKRRISETGSGFGPIGGPIKTSPSLASSGNSTPIYRHATGQTTFGFAASEYARSANSPKSTGYSNIRDFLDDSDEDPLYLPSVIKDKYRPQSTTMKKSSKPEKPKLSDWDDFESNGVIDGEFEKEDVYENTFDIILSELNEECGADPDCGYQVTTLPDISSTSELFGSAYRGESIFADAINTIRPEIPDLSEHYVKKQMYRSSTSQSVVCGSIGYLSPFYKDHERISAKARDNCQDLHGNFNIVNSTIGRCEYMSMAMTYYGRHLQLTDPESSSHRYSHSSEDYDSSSLCADNFFERTPQQQHPQNSSSLEVEVLKLFPTPEATLSTSEDEFAQMADNIFQKIQSGSDSRSKLLSSSQDDTSEYEEVSEGDDDATEEADEIEPPPIIEIQSTRYRTYRGISNAGNSYLLPTNRKRRNYLCVFCKGNNEPEEVYKSHPIRVNGVVMCPFLRNHVCAICKETGHTIKYCPQNRRGFFAQKALEKSKSLTNSAALHNGIENTMVFTASHNNGIPTRSVSGSRSSRRPNTAPASLATQSPRVAEEFKKQDEVFKFDNNYTGTVFMVKKTTGEESSSGLKNTHGYRLRKARGGKKRRGQNYARSF